MAIDRPKTPLYDDVRIMVNKHDSYRRNAGNLSDRRRSVRARTHQKVEASTDRLAKRVRHEDALFDLVVIASEQFREAIDATAGLDKRSKDARRQLARRTFEATIWTLAYW